MTEKNRGGRPSKFTLELAEKICERLAQGESLRSIGRDESMPADSTMRRWLVSDDAEFKEFQAQYARARDVGLDAMVDEILDIAHDGSNDWMKREGKEIVDHEHISRSRLRIDTLKWYASKLAPKRYGDRLSHEHSGANGQPLIPTINVTISSEEESARD